jgi:predicted DNA-binding protein YlxM (UPF0122 family)
VAEKLTPAQWLEIRELYIQGVSISRISRDFDIARTSIKARAKKHQWVKLSPEEIEEAAQAKLHAVHSVSTRAEIVDKVADARVQMIQKHQRAWDKLYKVRDDAHRILEGQRPRTIAHRRVSEGGAEEIVRDLEFKDMKDRVGFARKLIEIFEADGRALSAAQEGERRANGFDYKAQQATDTKDEGAERERKRLMASLVQTANAIKAMQVQKQTETESA